MQYMVLFFLLSFRSDKKKGEALQFPLSITD